MKTTFKKAMSLTLACYFAAAAVPMAVFAEGEEAQIGEMPYTTFGEALAAVTTGDTITLLTDVDYTSGIEVGADKVLTIDLNGHALDIAPVSGNGITATGSAQLTVSGAGTLSVDAAEDGLLAYGAGSSINIVATADITAGTTGAAAQGGGSIIVNGDVEGALSGAFADGASSSVEVTNATSTADTSVGVYVNDGGTAVVHGDATGVYIGASAGGGATGGGNVTVEGNAVATGQDGTGVQASKRGEVIVRGDAVANGSNGVGAAADSNGTVIIDGVIDATSYIALSDNGRGAVYDADQYSPRVTRIGYLAYTNGNSTTVWIKDTVVDRAVTELTFSAGTGGRITAGTSGTYIVGSSVPVTAVVSSGYAFGHWTASIGSFANPNSLSTSFTVPENPVTVTATFTYVGSGNTDNDDDDRDDNRDNNNSNTGNNTSGSTEASPASPAAPVAGTWANPVAQVTADALKEAIATSSTIYIQDTQARLDADAVAALQNASAPVNFKAPSYWVTIDPKSITEVKAIDLSLAITATSAPTSVSNVAVPANAIVIAPAAKGEFGLALTVIIPPETLQNIDPSKAKLYYISDSGELTELGGLVLRTDGSASITITHASQYVIAEQAPVVSGAAGADEKNPVTGNRVPYALIAAAMAASGLGVWNGWKRRKAAK